MGDARGVHQVGEDVAFDERIRLGLLLKEPHRGPDRPWFPLEAMVLLDRLANRVEPSAIGDGERHILRRAMPVRPGRVCRPAKDQQWRTRFEGDALPRLPGPEAGLAELGLRGGEHLHVAGLALAVQPFSHRQLDVAVHHRALRIGLARLLPRRADRRDGAEERHAALHQAVADPLPQPELLDVLLTVLRVHTKCSKTRDSGERAPDQR